MTPSTNDSKRRGLGTRQNWRDGGLSGETATDYRRRECPINDSLIDDIAIALGGTLFQVVELEQHQTCT